MGHHVPRQWLADPGGMLPSFLHVFHGWATRARHDEGMSPPLGREGVGGLGGRQQEGW